MTIVFQAVGCILIATILANVLKQQGSFVGILVVLLVCVGGTAIFLSFLEPVLQLLASIRQLANLDMEMIAILLKAVAIGVVCEICSLICGESGYSSMARTVELVGMGAILWLCIPMLQALLDLIKRILEGI